MNKENGYIQWCTQLNITEQQKNRGNPAICNKMDGWRSHYAKWNKSYWERKPQLIMLLLLFSGPVVSDSLQPHRLQHARPPCPSPSPKVCPSSCPLIGDTIQPSHPMMSSSSVFSFPSIKNFSNELAIHIRLPKYWSFRFSINLSN